MDLFTLAVTEVFHNLLLRSVRKVVSPAGMDIIYQIGQFCRLQCLVPLHGAHPITDDTCRPSRVSAHIFCFSQRRNEFLQTRSILHMAIRTIIIIDSFALGVLRAGARCEKGEARSEKQKLFHSSFTKTSISFINLSTDSGSVPLQNDRTRPFPSTRMSRPE